MIGHRRKYDQNPLPVRVPWIKRKFRCCKQAAYPVLKTFTSLLILLRIPYYTCSADL